jgi:hypothetical protein
VILRRVILRRVILRRVILRRVILRRVILRRVNLRRVILRRANQRRANQRRANQRRANQRRVIQLPMAVGRGMPPRVVQRKARLGIAPKRGAMARVRGRGTELRRKVSRRTGLTRPKRRVLVSRQMGRQAARGPNILTQPIVVELVIRGLRSSYRPGRLRLPMAWWLSRMHPRMRVLRRQPAWSMPGKRPTWCSIICSGSAINPIPSCWNRSAGRPTSSAALPNAGSGLDKLASLGSRSSEEAGMRRCVRSACGRRGTS